MEQNVFGIVPEEGTPAFEAEGTPSEKKPAPQAPTPTTTPGEQVTPPVEPASPTPAPEPPPPAEPAPQDPAPEPAPVEDDDEDGELVARDGKGFRIGNKIYTDLLAADQAFRQTRGRAQAADKRANALQKERDELLQQVAALKATREAQTPPTPAATATPAASAGDDGEGLTQLLTSDEINTLIAEEGADVALVRMQERMEKRTQELLERGTAPLRQQEQIAEYQRTAISHFEELSNLADEAGNHVYPELSDERTAPQIVATWDRLILEDPDFREFALSKAGVKYAYQVWKAGQPHNSQPAPTPQPGPTGEEQQAAALQGMGRSRPTATTPNPGAPPAALPARTEEAVRKLVEARTHPVFGIEVETAR